MKKDDWLNRVGSKEEVDLSRDEDLSIALMNLVSLEEHFYFTAMKTGNQRYLDLLLSVREQRKRFLAKMLKDPQGEEWCVSKHLLAASMRLYEVGVKELSAGGEPREYFDAAFELWSLFFGISRKMIGMKDLRKDNDKKLGRFANKIRELVDCCKEW